MVDTVERAIYEMGVKGADQIAAAGRALDGLTVSQEKVTKATRTTTASFERMQASYDPQIRAVQRMEAEFERLARHVADGIGSSAQQSRLLDSIVAKYDAQAAAINRAAVAHENLRRQQANSASPAGGVSATQLIGAQLSSVNVSTYAEEFERALADHDRMVTSAKTVKAAIDPLGTAFQKLATDVAYFNKLQKEGHLTQQQAAAASALAVKRYEDVAQSLKHAGTAGRVASGEIVNLTYQLNDVVTGLALGQSPFMILAQQGSQVFQIFQNSKAGLVDFAKEVGTRIWGLVTPFRALIGVAGLLGLAGFAVYESWKKTALLFNDVSRQAGVAIGVLRSLDQAAAIKGIGTAELLEGMKSFSAQVYEAKHGFGELATLIRANGGSAKGIEESLLRVADIIKGMPDGQARINALQQAGLPATQQWVEFLKQGSVAIRAAMDDAVQFGSTSEENMIAKAKAFDEAWNKAVKNFKSEFVAAFVTIFGFFDALYDRALSGARKVALAAGVDVKGNLLRSGSGEQLTNTKAGSFYDAVGIKSGEAKTSVDPAVLAKTMAREQQRIGILGQMASVSETVRAVELQIAQARLSGINITNKEEETLKRLAREQAIGVTQVNAQADAEKVRMATLLMSSEAALAYSIVQTKVNEAIAKGAPLTTREISDLQKSANAYAKVKTQADLYADTLKLVRDGFDDVGKSMFSAFLSGKSMMDAMVQSLDNLAKKLSDSAFDNILTGLMTGNLAQAGIGAVQAGASALISMFTGDQKAKKELEEAKKRWAGMADQVTAFNHAAAGFDLGPLTNELNSMRSTFETLRRAADEAGDAAGAAQLNEAFMAGTRRIVDEFKRGAETLSPLQTAIRAVNDEYRGLTETLIALNYGSLTIGLDEAAAAQIRKIIGQYTDELNASLAERLNNANGQSYLNDAAALLKRRQADLALAAELGNDPSVLAQISLVFHAEAQKIVDDAGLVGSAFTDFTTQFPDLAGVVVQANEDMTASAKRLADQMNASARSITDYVNGLFAGSASTLSPTAQLAAAQSTYNAKLALAQGGNLDAQGSITQDAENLRQAARAVFASGSGYQQIFSQITSQLLALPAVQSTTDPVTAAVRDVVTATQAGNATLALVNANTSATVAAAQSIAALQTASNTLITTTNNLTTSQNGILTAIQGLNQTSATQLTLLQQQLAPSSVVGGAGSVTAATKGGGTTEFTVTVNNRMLEALNKIVLNTYQISINTAYSRVPNSSATQLSSDRAVIGVYAQGGWITGGRQGVDSVPLASGALGMPGEFVVRNAVAQANAAWLPAFNRTGQMPSNDNGGVIAAINMLRASNEMMQRQIAQLIYEAGEKGAQATRASIRELRDETRLRKRDQRAA